MAQTVPGNVRLVVNLTPVDTRTDVVVVLQDGRVIIVPQVKYYYILFNILRIRVEGLTKNVKTNRHNYCLIFKGYQSNSCGKLNYLLVFVLKQYF